ncbi:conjugative relaxase-like TrwC/TraI family protein [Mucilaginibacter gracilis]|uniref:Conjugative relaxase-like TrwC/TraI family protein n=1 Tax=Mucilaginibacter gracilis TaxID=423350 RepID=A0A495J837_9SPHI|nr:MobF family relaxase [Mucilaginibacter gracilis]RKR84199.1 conjugative relaxase-like TrwC/TraI family protein [Mucilaginibacter gracilis]
MLRITMNKSASGAKKYYCEQTYKEGHSAEFDYYGEGSELIGKWGGRAAKRLDLTGSIEKKAFAQLCDNINPLTRKTLTGRNDIDRTVGYDFTFNASKSVSLAYAFADVTDKRIILDAFQSAVRDTMTDIETGMQTRVRAKGKNENRMTGNIAYGEFTHFTTRPIDGVPDPHLHSHCFVFNATFDGEDNKWKAGQFQQVKQDAPYYEAIFHAKLAQRLQGAGYQVTRTKNGFELAGIDKRTLDKFSRRTQEIEDYTREHGITDEVQKSKIGAKTREAKRTLLTAEQQESAWLSRLTPDEQTALLSLKQKSNVTTDDQAAKRALQFSLSHHLERKSVASDKEILATAIKAAIGEASPEQVRQAFKQEGNILSVTEKLRTFITTKEALKEEKQLIQHCIAARNKFRPIYEQYEPQNSLLNDQQKAAVKHALSSTDGIVLITGKAGTGKTTLMKEVQLGIIESGKQIFSFAPSSEASRGVQRSEGFDNADTVARLVQQTNLHPNFKNQVIWIDEAGMLSNKDMNRVLAIAQAQSARVILSGDTKQHTSVERGDAMRIIQQETGIKPVTVNKIQRQKNMAYKEAVQQLSDGKVEQGFKKLDRMGAIQEIADSAQRVNAVADEYCKATYNVNGPAKEVLVIAPTHAEGEIVTDKIREKLKEDHRIGQEDRTFEVLKNRQLTEAEKQQPESYRLGDVVIFHQNSKGVKAGEKLQVSEADEAGVQTTNSAGENYSLALAEAIKFTVFEPRPLAITEGDKLRMTANVKSNEGKHLFNGSVFQVEGFDPEGQIELSNGSTIAPDFGHFNLGYVSTSHASQGKTADQVIISQSSATFKASSLEQFYVSVSRGREAVSIYTDDKDQLLDAVSQSSERISATELMAKRQEQAQEINRLSNNRPRIERTPTQQDHINTQNTSYGLQTATRTEQSAVGR